MIVLQYMKFNLVIFGFILISTLISYFFKKSKEERLKFVSDVKSSANDVIESFGMFGGLLVILIAIFLLTLPFMIFDLFSKKEVK